MLMATRRKMALLLAAALLALSLLAAPSVPAHATCFPINPPICSG
jgi:hypothetical protein